MQTRLTLEPEYNDLENFFSCHVKRKTPEVSYLLWFYVSIPEIGFETPRSFVRVEEEFRTEENIRAAVKADPGAEDQGHSWHQFQHEFVTIASQMDLSIDDEMLIQGRRREGQWTYAIRSLRGSPLGTSVVDFPPKGVWNHTGRKKYKLHPRRPFHFSTANWRRKLDCRLDEVEMSELKGQLSIRGHASPGTNQTEGGDEVFEGDHSVSPLRNADDRVRFLVNSKLANPSVRITIPGL